MAIRVVQLPALSDNYNYLLVEDARQEAIAIDPSGENPVRKWLEEHRIRLTAIWNTHHHHDHTGGNLPLISRYEGVVLGPSGENIPGKTQSLNGGERFHLWDAEVNVLFTPGHTLGHIAYYVPSLSALFSGDVLFSAGCGRLFEGTPGQALQTLQLICELPDETLIYGAHEYSKVNTEFALQYEPGNPQIAARYREILDLRRKDLPTVPTTLGEEKAFNPFLRLHSTEIRSRLGLGPEDSELTVFTRLRELRNQF